MIRASLAPLALGLVLLTAPSSAGQETGAPVAGASSLLPSLLRAADAATQPTATPTAPVAGRVSDVAVGSGLKRFVGDVGRDYREWFTLDSTRTLMVGTAAAMTVRPADEALTKRGFPEAGDALTLGDEYGNLMIQVPAAIGWWAVGHSIAPRHGDAGRDLLRAQISAASWTYGIKLAVGRTRPNGDPRSFPSGHTSATFATATVLHRHYGWKLALPFYGLGVYTAAARIHERKHWLSDTVMGATVGITAGRAVTVRLKQRAIHVVPAKIAGGAMIQFVVDP